MVGNFRGFYSENGKSQKKESRFGVATPLALPVIQMADLAKRITSLNKNSAAAEMGDRGHNRHGPKTRGVLCPFRGALGTRLIQCGLRRCLLPYQVASSSIEPFGHNSVGCHSPRSKSVRTTT